MGTSPVMLQHPAKNTGWAKQVEEISASIGRLEDQSKKRDSVIDGLMKALEQPASKAGLSPQEFFAKITNGGNTTTLIGTDGTIMPVVPNPSRQRTMGGGFGEFLEASFEFFNSKGSNERARTALNTMGMQVSVEDNNGGIRKAALAESSGVTGGYTIPLQFSNNLLRLANEQAMVRPRATIMPMTALTMQVPSLDMVTAQGAGVTPFLGGVQATWTAEASTRTESEPAFKQTELKAHELSFYCVASKTLLADSAIGMDALLTTLFPEAITWFSEYAYFQGNGVGKPTGILNSGAAIAVTRSGGANTSTFTFADAAAMLGSLYLRTRETAWFMSQSVFPKLITLNDGSTSGHVVWIPLSAGARENPLMADGVQAAGTLLGHPVFLTEKLPSIGKDGDVVLADCSKYLIGDRAEIEIEVSDHVKFLTNQRAWRVVYRTDGQPWLSNSITLADATTKVSPFVYLH